MPDKKEDSAPEVTPHPQPVPPMPVHLPTSDAERPHTSPLRHDGDEPIDPELPPEPGNDPNP